MDNYIFLTNVFKKLHNHHHLSYGAFILCVCVCVCVCERERERERGGGLLTHYVMPHFLAETQITSAAVVYHTSY